VSLLRIGVRTKTGIFQIKKVNSRRLPIGSAKCFFEKSGTGTAADHDSINLLSPGARGKLVNVNFGIARKKEYRWDDGKNELFATNRKCLATVTEEQPPIRPHVRVLSQGHNSVNVTARLSAAAPSLHLSAQLIGK